MSRPAHLTLPPAAVSWLTGEEPVRVLTLSCSPAMIARLVELGHGVISVEADPARAARLAVLHRDDERVVSMVGRADELPLQPCTARVVLVAGGFRSQPGGPAIRSRVAHGQLSRTLQPGGWVAGWQIIRDDSVPWVRRLIGLLRSVDADAMTAANPDEHADLLASKYFPRTEQRDFRLWVPITRTEMVEMITRQRGVAALDEASRRRLLGEASQIFDSAARLAGLHLPYQLQCWRAHVDHHELTQPITFSDGALVIPI